MARGVLTGSSCAIAPQNIKTKIRSVPSVYTRIGSNKGKTPEHNQAINQKCSIYFQGVRPNNSACRVPFESSSPWLMLLFYWAAAGALVAFSYATAALFTSTRVAALLCPLIYLLSMVPAFLAVYSQVQSYPALCCCCCCCCCCYPGGIVLSAIQHNSPHKPCTRRVPS